MLKNLGFKNLSSNQEIRVFREWHKSTKSTEIFQVTLLELNLTIRYGRWYNLKCRYILKYSDIKYICFVVGLCCYCCLVERVEVGTALNWKRYLRHRTYVEGLLTRCLGDVLNKCALVMHFLYLPLDSTSAIAHLNVAWFLFL